MNSNEPNNDGFDSHYDVILTGTDLTSSLLSAALCKIGKKVLHLDSDKHYGKEWRSMKLSDLLLWPLIVRQRSEQTRQESEVSEFIDDDNENDVQIDSNSEQIVRCHRPNLFSNIDIDFAVFQNPSQYQKFLTHLLKTNKSSTQLQEFVERFYEDCLSKFISQQSSVKMTFEEGTKIIENFKDQHSELNRIDNMFVFDLCPRFLFSNEKIVKILIDSTVTKYIEFKKISRLLTPMKQEIQKKQTDNDDDSGLMEIVEVPCTRGDIFMSDIISPLEKRYLWSFLEKCYRLERNHEWYRDYADKPLVEFLRTQTLTEKLQKFIVNTLLMTSEPTATAKALDKINKFLQSFGRFCDRPFLFPLYGSEDVIQAFCRHGAVWGGLYCLGVSIRALIIDSGSNQCKAVLVNKYKISCDHLVTDYRMNHQKLNEQQQQRCKEKQMSRAIILSTKSIKTIDPENEATGDLSFIHLPPEFTGLPVSVYCFESDYSSRVCPKYFYMQYFWCDSVGSTAKHDLQPLVNKLLSMDQETQHSELPHDLRKRILISIYFNYKMVVVNDEEKSKTFPRNIQLVSTPINELNYEQAANEAERIFSEMYPGEEFFPPEQFNNNKQQQTIDGEPAKDPLDEIEI